MNRDSLKHGRFFVLTDCTRSEYGPQFGGKNYFFIFISGGRNIIAGNEDVPRTPSLVSVEAKFGQPLPDDILLMVVPVCQARLKGDVKTGQLSIVHV